MDTADARVKHGMDPTTATGHRPPDILYRWPHAETRQHPRAVRTRPVGPRRYVLGPGRRGARARARAHLVATPIGNLRDITLRALEVLAAADVDRLRGHPRHPQAGRPLRHRDAAHALSRPQRRAARPKLIARLAAGAAIALVSDAGTPLVSDPGFKLVRAAHDAGHAVTAVPGASATLAALAVAGLPTDRFFFEGFLPAKAGQRRTRIAELARIPATLVLFESGPRLAAALADLADGLGAREAAVCRELTKLHEEVRRGDLAALAAHYAAAPRPRGEIVLVIAPPAGRAAAAPPTSTRCCATRWRASR